MSTTPPGPPPAWSAAPAQQMLARRPVSLAEGEHTNGAR